MIDFKDDPNNANTLNHLKYLSKRIGKGTRFGLWRFGKLLVKETKKDILRKPRSGKTYYFRSASGRRKRHIASVRGEAPASRTGTLWRSLDFNVEGQEKMFFGYSKISKRKTEGKMKNTKCDYGKYLEPENRLNRPALKLNINRNTLRGAEILDEEIRKRM